MLHYSIVWSEWWYLFEEYSVQQKARVETYAFVNFMKARFGTTKPDFSELK